MKKPYLFVIILAILFINGCNNDDLDVDPNYPTIIEAISDNETDQLIGELTQTPMALCQAVDVFGFPFVNLEDTLCIDEENWRYYATEKEIADSAKTAIYTYGHLLNVLDTAEIEILSITTPDDILFEKFNTEYPDSAPPVWVITTRQQYYNDLLVRTSFLSIILAPDHVVGIGGHWYDNIYIPAKDNFSEIDAQESLYNLTIKSGRSEIIPTSEMTWHEAKKVIVPLRRYNEIELRVCWALYPSTWEILVDSQTGEVIAKINVSDL